MLIPRILAVLGPFFFYLFIFFGFARVAEVSSAKELVKIAGTILAISLRFASVPRRGRTGEPPF